MQQRYSLIVDRARARHLAPSLLCCVIIASLLGGCRDKQKESAAFTGPTLERLLPTIDRDIKQVRVGLPKVAAQLPRYLDDDLGADLEGLKRALTGVRGRVYELAAAKTTFLVFLDDKGVVVRGENDPDLAVGHSLIEPLPGMKPLLTQSKGLVETLGYMHGLRGVQKGGDLQWVVGTAVIDKGGIRKGSLVTGWSFRRYAGLLEANARQHAEKEAEGKRDRHPLLYVFLLKGNKAYGGPITPDFSAKAIGDLALPSKLKGDEVTKSAIRIEDRDYAIGARALPDLGDGVAIAVLVSVL